MRYFLDTEFNGMGGDLISLALVREDGRELYISTECRNPCPWVNENVIPIIRCEGAHPTELSRDLFGRAIGSFLHGDEYPRIVADWPDDIKYFCQAIIVAPGEMIDIRRLGFELLRIDAYPTSLPNAIRHNALWDARALRHAA